MVPEEWWGLCSSQIPNVNLMSNQAWNIRVVMDLNLKKVMIDILLPKKIQDLEKHVPAFILIKLNYCNCAFTGLSKNIESKSKKVIHQSSSQIFSQAFCVLKNRFIMNCIRAKIHFGSAAMLWIIQISRYKQHSVSGTNSNETYVQILSSYKLNPFISLNLYLYIIHISHCAR